MFSYPLHLSSLRAVRLQDVAAGSLIVLPADGIAIVCGLVGPQGRVPARFALSGPEAFQLRTNGGYNSPVAFLGSTTSTEDSERLELRISANGALTRHHLLDFDELPIRSLALSATGPMIATGKRGGMALVGLADGLEPERLDQDDFLWLRSWRLYVRFPRIDQDILIATVGESGYASE
jgi:hypothetical protein